MKKLIFIIIFGSLHIFGFAQWNTDRILTIGRNALYFEDYVLSIQYFNQVIKIKPYMAEPYMYRAMAKIQLGDDKGAELDATESIERNPFVPQAYYIRGFARRNLKLYDEAVKDFSKAYEFSPDNMNLLLNRMDANMRLENYKDAMTDLDTYMRLNPKSNLYYEKGFIQLATKDTLAAEISFNEYIKRDSTSSNGWSARALLHMQKNETEKAYNDYSQAIKYNSKFSGDYINRGILNVQRKNFRQALSDYDNAIKLDKKGDLAYYNRALLRANLGDNNNALSDLNMVLTLDSANYDALYRRAMLNNTLRLYRNAIADFNKIIGKYPYFIPAYWGIAEAQDGLGNSKESFRYRQQAYEIEKNKDNIKKKAQIAGDNKIAANAPKSAASRKTEIFNRFVNQDIDDSQSDTKYQDGRRGNIQNIYTDVVNEKNFVLSYYSKPDEIRRTNLYEPIVEDYNKRKVLSTVLKITNNELALTSELVNQHFDEINNISKRIAADNANADLYFYRALEFALVQDFNSSIEDLNKALSIRSDFVLAYFCRANIRYKYIEYKRSTLQDNNEVLLEKSTEKSKRLADETQAKFDAEMIMRDYDKVIGLAPDFSFAYFNKANVLCTQSDFKTAITNYNKAIESDPDFAEAYFNRGLTYLFIGEDSKGLNDLSKAGELGIYKSYNLLQRFSDK
ncbi:MAG: Tetratricopeptide 1 repeat-containing protein [Bacteroidetes bacterium]|nr:Tetratricopeptide 1 repeat-containing protein [Bacteroidota bacterium]